MSQRSQPNPPKKQDSSSKAALAGWKLWRFRLLSLLLAPFALIAVEVVLRLAGFGHPTSFLLPSVNHNRKTFVQNNEFGVRFFGKRRARAPYPLSILQEKPADTIRIFVFGESAAYGDPQPVMGLPRVLQAILSLRHPGTKFEVVNAAMTAIDSHVIVPIARDCAQAGGDIFVIYMGNNEVVGPFGAGTVFGPQAPQLGLVRATLAIKATRLGECMDSLRNSFRKTSSENEDWGGMAMFLGQQVRADDPRMATVYRSFSQNLADIIWAGRGIGAGIVISTVAVNLKDCAPFASEHRPGLTEADKTQWEQLYKAGIAAEQNGNLSEAEARFQAAAHIDDTMAELRFRLGSCALASGRLPEAREQFSSARDLDTLRFRCDSRLNELIRQAAAGRESDRVLLADAEQAGKSPDKSRILIVDDHPLFCEGLCRMIDRHPSLAVCGNVPDAASALKAVSELKPDLVIMDISLEGTNGIDVTKSIKAKYPDLPVLVVSMHDEALYAERALRAGAQGYIMKNQPIQIVRDAIFKVLGGDIFLSDKMSTTVLAKLLLGKKEGTASSVEQLSDRELEVFQMLGEGKSSRQIAETLNLTIPTIHSFRNRIKEKLNYKNSTELVLHAMRWVREKVST